MLALTAALVILLAACSWLGLGGGVEEPDDPFKEGVLKAVAHLAPPNSTSQFLSRIAEQLGWEQEVTQNTLLRVAVQEEEFDEKVEPYLLSVFFAKGFSVLPSVGEGHQFSRDSIVRGSVADNKFLVTTRELVRIIFLQPMENVQIIYPQDGTQPQIFSPDPEGILAVRKSLSEQYLR